ncbi:MAG: hypothetical protein GY929_16810 [Actinomycetia bacterium]|nr:hypothetical protein [Actinomycetes bacterium]
MNLVGELVLSPNQIVQLVARFAPMHRTPMAL